MRAAAAAILLAGCLAAAPVPEAAPEGVVLADLTSADCHYNDLIFLTPIEQAQAHLPAGFHARPLLPDAPDTGALVINFFGCGQGIWSAADLFVIIEPPVVPGHVERFDADNRTPGAEADLSLDLYSLHFHTDDEAMRGLLDRAGVPHAPGRTDKTSLPAPTGSLAQGGVVDDDGPLVTYAVAGADTGAYFVLHRQWHQSASGLVLLERFFSQDGGPVPVTQGAAQCTLRPGSPFADLLGATPCALGQDVAGPWGWTGRAYLFPGDGAGPP